jgi:integrase/recombinase XerD
MKAAHTPNFKQQYATHLKRLRLQGLQPKTVEAYALAIRHVGAYFDERIDDLTEAQLTDYFSELMASKSWSTVRHRLYGLKFYYTHVLHKPFPAAHLIKPPTVRRLPNVVTVAEAGQLFAATRVVSYRVLYFTLYSLGLRLGEGLRLQVGDIDAARQRVHIRNAKGNKDRLVPLPAATLVVLRRFWQLQRNPRLVFPSRQGGMLAAAHATTALDRSGVQVTLRKVAAQCGLKKTLPRTRFATATPRI